MAEAGIVIEAGSRLILTVSALKGRGKISLDKQTLFQEMNLKTPADAIVRILPEGDHRLDFTASNFGGERYDFKTTVKVQKDGQPESILTSMHLASSGSPDDTSDGETMHFKAAPGE